jgi:hypothetical protein
VKRTFSPSSTTSGNGGRRKSRREALVAAVIVVVPAKGVASVGNGLGGGRLSRLSRSSAVGVGAGGRIVGSETGENAVLYVGRIDQALCRELEEW